MDAQWLKTQFSLNPEKTKTDLARALGLEPPAVSKMVKGTRQIKAGEYIQMRVFFGLSDGGETPAHHRMQSYVLQPLGDEETSPLAVLGEQARTVPDSSWVLPAEILSQRTKAPPEQIRICQIRENTMEPHFRQGEHVLVDVSDTIPSPPGFFVISDGYGIMVRECASVPGSRPLKVKISAPKNDFQTQTLALADFNVIGRVIAKLQMV